MVLDGSPEFFKGTWTFFFSGIETLVTKSLFCKAILKRSPVIHFKFCHLLVAVTPTFINTAMIFMNRNSENELWARSPMDNFLKTITSLIVAINVRQTRTQHAGANNRL